MERRASIMSMLTVATVHRDTRESTVKQVLTRSKLGMLDCNGVGRIATCEHFLECAFVLLVAWLSCHLFVQGIHY